MGLAGAVVFFLISGGVAYFNLRTLRDDNQKIVHSHEVITTLDELLSGAQNAETGQRGYLLTNNEKYLEPYNAALIEIPPKLDQITELTRDNPAQKPRIDAFDRTLARNWLNSRKRSIFATAKVWSQHLRSSIPIAANLKWTRSARKSRPWRRKRQCFGPGGSPK